MTEPSLAKDTNLEKDQREYAPKQTADAEVSDVASRVLEVLEEAKILSIEKKLRAARPGPIELPEHLKPYVPWAASPHHVPPTPTPGLTSVRQLGLSSPAGGGSNINRGNASQEQQKMENEVDVIRRLGTLERTLQERLDSIESNAVRRDDLERLESELRSLSTRLGYKTAEELLERPAQRLVAIRLDGSVLLDNYFAYLHQNDVDVEAIDDRTLLLDRSDFQRVGPPRSGGYQVVPVRDGPPQFPASH